MDSLSSILSAVLWWSLWLAACTGLAIVLVWMLAARTLPAIYLARLNRRDRSPCKTPKSAPRLPRSSTPSAPSKSAWKWRW